MKSQVLSAIMMHSWEQSHNNALMAGSQIHNTPSSGSAGHFIHKIKPKQRKEQEKKNSFTSQKSACYSAYKLQYSILPINYSIVLLGQSFVHFLVQAALNIEHFMYSGLRGVWCTFRFTYWFEGPFAFFNGWFWFSLWPPRFCLLTSSVLRVHSRLHYAYVLHILSAKRQLSWLEQVAEPVVGAVSVDEDRIRGSDLHPALFIILAHDHLDPHRDTIHTDGPIDRVQHYVYLRSRSTEFMAIVTPQIACSIQENTLFLASSVRAELDGRRPCPRAP